MIDIKTLTDKKIDDLIQHLETQIISRQDVINNEEKLSILKLEKAYRNQDYSFDCSLKLNEVKKYSDWREGKIEHDLPEAIVVDDIKLTTNTVNISLDEVMQNADLRTAFNYHKAGHIDYSKLSKEELESYMDAYAKLIVQGIEKEKSEAILEDLFVIYIKRFEDVPTNTIQLVREDVWNESLKDKVEYRTSDILSMPSHQENVKKVKLPASNLKTSTRLTAYKQRVYNKRSLAPIFTIVFAVGLALGILLHLYLSEYAFATPPSSKKHHSSASAVLEKITLEPESEIQSFENESEGWSTNQHFQVLSNNTNGPVTGRWVKVILPGNNKILSLAEVEVISNGVNVAKAKHAAQSSIQSGGIARRAVDGNPDIRWEQKSITHTRIESNPWWIVDLGRLNSISEIKLYNRLGLETRLIGAIIQILNDKKEVIWSVPIKTAQRSYSIKLIRNEIKPNENFGPKFGKVLGRFHGNSGKQAISKIFQTNEAQKVVFNFDIIELGTWDNEDLVIYINEIKVFLVNWGGNADEEYQGRSGNISWQVKPMQAVHVFENLEAKGQVHKFTITIENPRPSIKLGFGATLDSPIADESWAIDNFQFIRHK